MELIPKFLKNIIDDFKLENIIQWVEEVFIFLFKPQKFVTQFYSKEIKFQIHQIIFYTLTLLIFFFTFSNGSTPKEYYRFLFIVLFISVPFIIINFASFAILSKMTVKYWKVFSFIYITWTIFFIPILMFLSLFVMTENYSFYFISNVFSTIAVIYSLFIIWSVFVNSIFKIILGNITNIFFLNVLFLILGFVLRDPHSNTKNLDPIINEFESYTSGIKSFSGEPYSFKQEFDFKNKGVKNSIGFIQNDTLEYHDDESIAFLRKLYKKNIHYIDSIKSKIHFERNKEMFSDLAEHYKLIDSYFDYPQCDTCLVSVEKTFNRKDSSLIKYKREFIIDKPYFKHFNSYKKRLDDIVDANEYATSPQLLFDFLLKPLQYLVEFMDWDTERTTVKIY
jgi:hypothetical protein